MRTLKKALCLVLVLAMVFTLAVPALAVDAKDFTDYAEIENKEAVDVLTAIGVINGNTDGTYGPEGNFTRAQAATMISYLTLGKTTADALPTSGTVFTDVPSTHWAAKYIQYCVDEGLLSGYGDGKFGPNDELTAAAWALMLARALGYNPANEGIGGTGWEIAATKLAISTGIATADDLAGEFNRDVAALMALNTLQAECVQYAIGGTTITTSDGTTINTGASAAAGTKQTFMQTYYSKLTRTADAAAKDSYGRPAHTWSYKNDTIGTYAEEATAVYVGNFTGKVVDNLNKQGYDLGNATIVYNGGDAGLKLADLYVSNSTGVNGYTVELFNTDTDTAIETIVVSEGYFAQITKFTAATNTKNASVEVKVIEHSNQKSLTITDDPDVADMYDVLAAYEKGDYVMVYAAPGWESNATKIFDVADVTAVSGTVTRVSTGSKVCTSTIALGGTTYALNNEFMAISTNGSYGTTVKAAEEGTLYLDAQGNAIAWVVTAETTTDNHIVPTDYYTSLVDGKLVNKVEGVDATGETITLTTDSTYAGLMFSVCTYTETETDDVYKLEEVMSTESGEIKSTAKKLGDNYFASDVKFIFIDKDGKAVTVKTGVQAVSDSYVVVTSTSNGVTYVDAVFVMAAYNGGNVTTSDIIFVGSSIGSISIDTDGDGKAEPYNTYKAYVNGELVDDFYTGTESVSTNTFYKSVKNETTGAYNLADGNKFTGTTTVGVATGAATYTAGVLSVDSKDLGTADAVVVDLSANGNGLTTGATVSVLYDIETMEATCIYVTVSVE